MENLILIPIPLEDLITKVESRLLNSLKELIEAQPEEEKFLTPTQTAKMLGISRPTLHRWTKNGTIESCFVGKSRRYKKSAVMTAARTAKKYDRKKN